MIIEMNVDIAGIKSQIGCHKPRSAQIPVKIVLVEQCSGLGVTQPPPWKLRHIRHVATIIEFITGHCHMALTGIGCNCNFPAERALIMQRGAKFRVSCILFKDIAVIDIATCGQRGTGQSTWLPTHRMRKIGWFLRKNLPTRRIQSLAWLGKPCF